MKLLIMDIPVRKSLFWDINIDRMDEQKNRRLIIERVFCLGNMEELKFIFRFYGINIIRKEVIKAGNLDSKTLNFASEILDIPVNEFRCYKRRQSVKSY